MQPVMNALKDYICVMVDTMHLLTPHSDWRIKVCGYGDSRSDGDSWWQESAFTNDIDKVREYIGSLKLIGGKDGKGTKSLLDALWKLSITPESETIDDEKWRYRGNKLTTRSVDIFTTSDFYMDTPISEAGGAKFDYVVREMESKKLQLIIFCPDADCYHVLSEIDRSEIEFIGTLSDSQEKMSEFAINTERFVNTMRDIAKSFPRYACMD